MVDKISLPVPCSGRSFAIKNTGKQRITIDGVGYRSVLLSGDSVTLISENKEWRAATAEEAAEINKRG